MGKKKDLGGRGGGRQGRSRWRVSGVRKDDWWGGERF